jgi:hypothetical protein
MLSHRYTIAVADQKSGIERRGTVSLATMLLIGALVMLPLVAAFWTAWKAKSDVQALYASHRALEIESANYRAAVEALTGQIESHQDQTAPAPPAIDLHTESVKPLEPIRSDRIERTPAPRTDSAPVAGPPVPAAVAEPASAAPVSPAIVEVVAPSFESERGADTEAAGRSAFAEALVTLGQTRALAEAADAAALAPRSYHAAAALELEAQQLSTAGRPTDALVKAVEATGRFRVAEIEARLQTVARERLRPADAPSPPRRPVAETREAPAEPADSPRAESRRPLQAPASRVTADVENAVRHVIAQYVSGLESRSVAALKRVWPSLGGTQERAIQAEFENARTVRALFTDPQITVNGDTTIVTGFRTYHLLTQDGQRLSSLTRTTMTLRRSGDEWLIARIVHKQ